MAASVGCGNPPPPYHPVVPLGLDAYMPVPDGFRLTRASVDLGRRLFFDGILSRDGSMSCASCHQPALAFADTVSHSIGIAGTGARRNTPTLMNVGYRPHLSWTGGSATLEQQVLLPIFDKIELGLARGELEHRLAEDPSYREAFQKAFGQRPSDETVARALASYLRTLLTADSPYDRFLAGDVAALSAEARRGRDLFVGRAGCSACHVGSNLTDGKFHNTGVAVRSGDAGRFTVTGREQDRGALQTPTLRNVAVTPPFMHDGSITSLYDVVEFYAGGGIANSRLDPAIRTVKLTVDERAALVAFLRSLTSLGTN